MAITIKKKGAYEVGYKKPPKATQFKPGQSGNPNGRPKGAKNLKTDLEEELREQIAIKEGGAPKNVSKQRAMIKALMAKAVQGDYRAANALLNMILKLFPDHSGDNEVVDLTETDEAILKDFERRVLERLKAEGKIDG